MGTIINLATAANSLRGEKQQQQQQKEEQLQYRCKCFETAKQITKIPCHLAAAITFGHLSSAKLREEQQMHEQQQLQ